MTGVIFFFSFNEITQSNKKQFFYELFTMLHVVPFSQHGLIRYTVASYSVSSKLVLAKQIDT